MSDRFTRELEMLLDSFFESNLVMDTEHPNCKYLIPENEKDQFEKNLKKLIEKHVE